MDSEIINIESLKVAGLIRKNIKRVRIMLSGEVTRALEIADINVSVSSGAKKAIEAAGGSVKSSD
jgi:large subunit ribosomal protein L15